MKNLKIMKKLFLLTSFIAGIMIVISMIFTDYADTIQSDYTKLLDNEISLDATARNITRSELMLRRHEKDFLLRLDLKYRDKHQKEILNIKKHINNLKTVAKANNFKEIQDKAIEIETSVDAYNADFRILVDAWITRGLSHSEGLQGELRKAVHNIETELKKLEADKLTIQMLSIRRSEKDYLLRYKDPASAEKYTKKTIDKVNSLKDQIKGNKYSSEIEATLVKLADEYLIGFSKLVAENVKIKDTIASMRADIHKVEPLIYGADNVVGVLAMIESMVGNKTDLIIQDTAENQRNVNILITFAILICLIFSKYVASTITAPLTQIVDMAKDLSQGDLANSVDFDRKDEIGELAVSLNTSVEKLSNMIKSVKGNSENVKEISENVKVVAQILRNQSDQLDQRSGNVAGATEQLTTNINAMASAIEELSVNAQSVSTSAEEISVTMTSVASAVEEMSASISLVADNAKGARETAAKAHEISTDASSKMYSLVQASDEIDKVTEVIKRIAEQTNLLALNATIEASSAGDAGKGFAVVANEIKVLAGQSTAAAEDIAMKINSVQANSSSTAEAIQEVNSIITSISGAVEEISESVDQQSSTATEIASNISEASLGIGEISHSISEIAMGVNEMATNASEISQGTTEVSGNILEVNGISNVNKKEVEKIDERTCELSGASDSLESILKQFKVA